MGHGGEKERRRKMRKYLEKENNWSPEEKKNEEGKGGKYLENDDIERRKIFGEGKHLVCVEYDRSYAQCGCNVLAKF